MYVYLAKFSNHQDLIKIGVSKAPKLRLQTLKATHGNYTFVNVYAVGDAVCYKLESLLHAMFINDCVSVRGDGYTEFFKDCVMDKAKSVIEAVGATLEYTSSDFYCSGKVKRVKTRKEKVEKTLPIKYKGHGAFVVFRDEFVDTLGVKRDKQYSVVETDRDHIILEEIGAYHFSVFKQ